MPTYEYKCNACGDVLESDTNDLMQAHPCQEPPGQYKRVWSLAGTVFKGSGWYHVDKRKSDGGTIGID